MMTVQSSADGGSGLALFAAELQAVRASAGLSQADLEERVNYSASAIAMIEQMRRTPQPDLARRLDDALGTPGTFVRLQQHARTAVTAWFSGYAETEAEATSIQSWQPVFIEGLLQTEDYARAVLSRRPNTSDDEVDALVAARLERQAIMERDEPPMLWLVLDETALYRQVGSEKIMGDQLDHLAVMSRRPNIVVEIVPRAAGAHYALLASFTVIGQGGNRLGYIESVLEGFIVEAAADVDRLNLIFDSLRSETLPRVMSRALIEKAANQTWLI